MQGTLAGGGDQGDRDRLVAALKGFVHSTLRARKFAKQFIRPVEQAFPGGSLERAVAKQFLQDLGPRKSRLLLAACCRHAIRQKSQGYSWKEQAKALAVLEYFADTGKGKTALRDSWRKSDRT